MAKRKRLNPTPSEVKSVSHAKQSSPAAPVGAVQTHAAPVAQVARDVASAAAVEEMATALSDARREGRFIVSIDTHRVDLTYVQRDRLMPEDIAGDDDMAALIGSLRDRGQQVPIDVVKIVGDPRERYGLISGLRRLTALRFLYAETKDPQYAKVRARIVRPEGLRGAYLAMVEENEIRADLSFYERGRTVVKAVETGAFDDIASALRGLYGHVSRAKRSKIGSFVPVVQALDGVLAFPRALSEKRGLALSRSLLKTPGLADTVVRVLTQTPPATAEAEQSLIAEAIAPKAPPAPPKQTLTLSNGGRALVIEAAAGRVALKGAAVDDDLIAALTDWAASRGFVSN